MLFLISRVDALMDVPYVNFLPELIALVPHVKLTNTVREPRVWASKRLFEHRGSDLVCRPPAPSTFYNLGTCLNNVSAFHEETRGGISDRGGVSSHGIETDAIAWLRWERAFSHKVAYQMLAARFAAHNAYVSALVPTRQYSQQCIWDAGKKKADEWNARELVAFFFGDEAGRTAKECHAAKGTFQRMCT